MKLGIGSQTYVWAVGVPGYPALPRPMTPLDLLDKATALGVRVVQIANNLPMHTRPEAEIDVLVREAEKRGIELELGTTGIEPALLRRYLEIARRLRSRILRAVIDTATHHPSPEEAIGLLTPLLPAFESAGVTLAIENHDRFKAKTLLEMLDRLNSPRVGICLDTANSLGCLEGTEHVVETLGPRVVNLHLKDVRASRLPHDKGFVVEGCAAGQGQLDIPYVLKRLRAFGRDPNAILELWPPPLATLDESVAREDDWTNQSVRYLRTLIPE